MEETADPKMKFAVVGLLVTPEFQKCKYIVESLSRCYPEDYEPSDVRGMMNVDWTEFLTYERRARGGQLWVLRKPVAVYCNDVFLGDETALCKFVSLKYIMPFKIDFYEVGQRALKDYFEKIMENGRRCVFLMIRIDDKVVGSMVFMLYDDIVPETCQLFLKRCNQEEGGYSGTRIHRVVRPSWVQCGGYNLKPVQMPCENYAVSHNKRGILSMCNTGMHKQNSTQFAITLDKNLWMDTRYVAFGELVHGDEVLQKIEAVPTVYQAPQVLIKIIRAGEFCLCMPKILEGPKAVETDELLRRRLIIKMFRNYCYGKEKLIIKEEARKSREGPPRMYWKQDRVSHKPLLELPPRILDAFNYIPGKASSCLFDLIDCRKCGCSYDCKID